MLILNLVVYLATLREACGANRISFISTERPAITWYNQKYFRYANITAQRYSRSDPIYYLGFHLDNIWPVHNNINIDFYFYEYVTNQYKRSSLELHFELCELLVKDLLFGISLGLLFPYRCPLQPGLYHVDNITVPLKKVPEIFPFSKGRIKTNLTSKDTNEVLGYGHIDLEMKVFSTRRTKNRNLTSFY